jgi:hypothetical protein
MVLSLLYLGWFQDTRATTWPLFFQVDWAPPILKFARHSEGEFRSVVLVGTSVQVLTAWNVQYIIALSGHSHLSGPLGHYFIYFSAAE